MTEWLQYSCYSHISLSPSLSILSSSYKMETIHHPSLLLLLLLLLLITITTVVVVLQPHLHTSSLAQVVVFYIMTDMPLLLLLLYPLKLGSGVAVSSSSTVIAITPPLLHGSEGDDGSRGDTDRIELPQHLDSLSYY